MRLLFLTSDGGGGFGHIARCLSIIQEAQDRDHECAIVLNDRKHEGRIKSKVKIYYSGVSHKKSIIQTLLTRLLFIQDNKQPAFLKFSGLDYQIIRDGLVNEETVLRYVNQYVNIVKQYKPHVIIGDTNLFACIVAKKTGIPVAQIIQGAYHPDYGKLVWWEDLSGEIIAPKGSLLFNPILEQMHLETIKRAEDLLRGDVYFVPGIPEIDPGPCVGNNIYVGELTAMKKEDSYECVPGVQHPCKKLVYVTIGGGARGLGNTRIVSSLIDALSRKNIEVIISTGGKNIKELHDRCPSNISVYPWVPGREVISRADLIVFHGGYGTMMECISCGKPTIVIPYHSEQEGNGRRLQDAGCGIVLMPSKAPFRTVESNWKYGRYTYHVQDQIDLTEEEIFQKVGIILESQNYEKNSKRLQSRANTYKGAKAVLDHLETEYH
jgi:UDP-N-acetylglucosamine:LPS N-acetylglucosamine transferase